MIVHGIAGAWIAWRAVAAGASVGIGLLVSGCAQHTGASQQAARFNYAAAPHAGAAPRTTSRDDGRGVDHSGRRLVRFPGEYQPGEIVVSFADRRLYFITRPREAISYPIAIPRDLDRWEGVIRISSKKENPSWTPTPSMVAENPRLPRWVPGGHEMNPLGVRALYLGESMYRIHGTDAPWTIGDAVSKGCIRMHNQDVLDLYPRAVVGGRVTVTWQRIATAG